MKIINQYKFKNKKIIRLCYVSAKDREKTRTPRVDNILFEWNINGKEFEGFYMRPDEVLMTAKQLIDAVYKITGSYNEKLLKGYYGYKEMKL